MRAFCIPPFCNRRCCIFYFYILTVYRFPSISLMDMHLPRALMMPHVASSISVLTRRSACTLMTTSSVASRVWPSPSLAAFCWAAMTTSTAMSGMSSSRSEQVCTVTGAGDKKKTQIFLCWQFDTWGGEHFLC